MRKRHQGHQGGKRMVHCTRELIYWQGMQTAILQENANCSACASYSLSLPKEEMLFHDISHGAWKFISQELFKQGQWWYAVTVDHISGWFEVDLLKEEITVAHVIQLQIKEHFTCYDVPDKFLHRQWAPIYLSRVREFC